MFLKTFIHLNVHQLKTSSNFEINIHHKKEI